MLIKLALGLVIGSTATSTLAQTATNIQTRTGDSAYAQDGRGVIVRNPYGLCWRAGYWTPADAVSGCDGQLIPPVAKITAPELPVMPAATPTPAARPAPRRCDFSVTLANGQSFVFNKAALSSTAMRRIDEEVLSKLKTCVKIENVTITGHTDRIGSQQYNQKLSEKRAGAVAAYLKSRGVATDIKTIGAGETQPIETCRTTRGRKQLIDCLAPNRRVDIDVRGRAN